MWAKLRVLVLICTLQFSYAQTCVAELDFAVGFSPYHGALQVVLQGIDEAKEQILVAAYSFTSKPVVEALLNAHWRGVKVLVVANESSNRNNPMLRLLAEEGIAVRLNSRYAIHHHKFMLIDEDKLELGSFNYSAAAARRNAENVLLLRNVAPIAAVYRVEWERLWGEAVPLEQK